LSAPFLPALVEFENAKMNLDLKRLSLADLRLKIFIETEIDLKGQFLELLELRERLRQTEQTRARSPRQSSSPQSHSLCRHPLPAVRRNSPLLVLNLFRSRPTYV
jgi:hypothetical protein